MALNAKYIHTNPAVRSIAAYSAEQGIAGVEYVEFTVNQRHADILRALYSARADCYLFSCYIWNIEQVRRLTADLAKLLPAAVLALGGPEADWQAAALLRALPQVHIIVRGEGEQSTCILVRALQDGSPLLECPGIAFRCGGEVRQTAPPPALSADALPFAYGDLGALSGRILYYESMRGCPFSCSYCLSGAGGDVRLRPLATVFRELQAFLDAGAMQVKFVDRTFNCDPGRAVRIWQFLQGHDNGVTNFHFELAGDMLDEEAVEILSAVRPGLFQFEIGIQSTNPATLSAVRRRCNFDALTQTVRQLGRARNIHLHLDLIAGLPYEDFARFSRSFDDVFALAPQQLQLGFLKLLGGSALRGDAERYGIVFQDTAPYEVLRTRWLSFDELCVLHGVDEMVDSFYNSGRFRYLLGYIIAHFPSPFACFRGLWEFFDRRQRGAPLSKIGYYDLLGAFMRDRGIAVSEHAQWLCLYDLMLHEKPRKLPDWVAVSLYEQHRDWLAAVRRRARGDIHLEVFPFCPPDGGEGVHVVVFDYSKRDITGRAAVQAVTKQAFLADLESAALRGLWAENR